MEPIKGALVAAERGDVDAFNKLTKPSIAPEFDHQVLALTRAIVDSQTIRVFGESDAGLLQSAKREATAFIMGECKGDRAVQAATPKELYLASKLREMYNGHVDQEYMYHECLVAMYDLKCMFRDPNVPWDK